MIKITSKYVMLNTCIITSINNVLSTKTEVTGVFTMVSLMSYKHTNKGKQTIREK